MRITQFAQLIPVVAILGATAPWSRAGDDLFSQSYRSYNRIANPHVPPVPDPVLPPTDDAPPAAAPAAEPAVTAAPDPSTFQIRSARPAASAPGVPRAQITWLKGGRGPAVTKEAPASSPAAKWIRGRSVAETLSAAAEPPNFVPPESLGMMTRMFRPATPEVPPGLPRGAAPVAMVPPEPLDRPSAAAAPRLTRLDRPPVDALRRSGGDADLATSRSSYAPSSNPGADEPAPGRAAAAAPSRPVERSYFTPVRPRNIAESALRPAFERPVPGMIARPSPPTAGQN